MTADISSSLLSVSEVPRAVDRNRVRTGVELQYLTEVEHRHAAHVLIMLNRHVGKYSGQAGSVPLALRWHK